MMKSGVFTIFLLLSSGLHLSKANSVEDRCRVKVELFYDTFCPDVIDFIQGKLYPAWEELSDIMEIHWKPYGFTQVSVLSVDKFQDLNFRLRIIWTYIFFAQEYEIRETHFNYFILWISLFSKIVPNLCQLIS